MATLVSIVIPTYNEAADITDTLDSLLALDYDAFEVVVVDASQDATPEIVARYPSDRVRLIRQSRGQGRAAARNEGILAAKGEIVIILNADVRLPHDFVRRILRHYEAGADYVLVESRVTNLDDASARYVQALHEFYYPPRPEVEAQMNWTEGFSCRRAAAIAVGLIPEGKPVHLVAGEDAWFSEMLARSGWRKTFDRNIVVTHVMPPVWNGFWPQRVGRGQGVVQIWHMRYGWPMRKVWLNVARLWLLSGLALLLPLPALWRGWQLSAYSPRGRADWLTFSALDWFEAAANLWGLLKGSRELHRAGAR
jgi:glycosyltransferase involved in cell wall biosynthesis